MQFVVGKSSGGQSLKKSPVEGANHCICGRKRFERTTAPLPHMVASRADSGAPIPLQLEDDFRNSRYHLVDFLLPAVSGNNSKSAGCGVSRSSDAPYPWRSSRDLGRPSQPSQSDGSGFRQRNQWTDGNGISSGLCAGTQPGGIYLGSLETS